MLLIFVMIKILWISLGFLSMIIMKFYIHGVYKDNASVLFIHVKPFKFIM